MRIYLATTMREIGQTLTLTKMGERERDYYPISIQGHITPQLNNI
jgi:hypothetical protein